MKIHPKVLTAWRSGTTAAVLAYTLWGALPIFWILLESIEPFELTSYRFLWATLLLALIIPCFSSLRSGFSTALQGRAFILILGSAAFLGINSVSYVWAINSHRMLEASLGYFLAPLLTIGVGVLVLGESLSPGKKVGVAGACIALLILLLGSTEIPWLGLIIGGSACGYALCRRVSPLGALHSFLADCLILAPIALGYLIARHGGLVAAVQAHSTSTHILLLLGGVFTIIPFSLFVLAIQRSGLTTVGFAQYLSPGIKFFLSIFVFSETVLQHQAPAFILIWLSLGVVTIESLQRYGWFRRTKNAGAVTVE